VDSDGKMSSTSNHDWVCGSVCDTPESRGTEEVPCAAAIGGSGSESEGMILLLVCLSDERPGRTDQLWGYSTSVEVLVRLE
jgi:hypothetical protein